MPNTTSFTTYPSNNTATNSNNFRYDFVNTNDYIPDEYSLAMAARIQKIMSGTGCSKQLASLIFDYQNEVIDDEAILCI